MAECEKASIAEAFAPLIEAAADAEKHRRRNRAASGGGPATTPWRYDGEVVAARTKSEARAAMKARRKLDWLPTGARFERVR